MHFLANATTAVGAVSRNKCLFLLFSFNTAGYSFTLKRKQLLSLERARRNFKIFETLRVNLS